MRATSLAFSASLLALVVALFAQNVTAGSCCYEKSDNTW